MTETAPRAPSLTEARETLVRCLLTVLLAERHLADPGAQFSVPAADDAMAFAARDLVDATDALPLNRKPKGWVS